MEKNTQILLLGATVLKQKALKSKEMKEGNIWSLRRTL